MHMCRNKRKCAKKRESGNVMNRDSRSYFGERERGRVRPKNKKESKQKKGKLMVLNKNVNVRKYAIKINLLGIHPSPFLWRRTFPQVGA